MSISEYDIVNDVADQMCDDCEFYKVCQGRYTDFDLRQLSKCIDNGFKPKFGQYRFYNRSGKGYRDFVTMEEAKKYQENNYSKNHKFAAAIKDRLTGIIYALDPLPDDIDYKPSFAWVEVATMKDRVAAGIIARHVDEVDKEDE